MSFAVVFDFDGVILDSETANFEAHRQIFEACGADLSPEEWCGQIGTWPHGSVWFERLCRRAARPPDESTFVADRSRRFRELVRMEPMPGVRPLLDELRAANVPLAIASTSPSSWVLQAAEAIGVRDLFATIVTADDVIRRKPAPDPYLEAARRLRVAAVRCVAVEDSQHGLASAKAAGMRVVVIPHWLTELHDLTRADLLVRRATELSLDRLRRLVEGLTGDG